MKPPYTATQTEELARGVTHFRRFYRAFSRFLRETEDDRIWVEEMVGPLSRETVYHAMQTSILDEVMERLRKKYSFAFTTLSQRIPYFDTNGGPLGYLSVEVPVWKFLFPGNPDNPI